LVVRGRTHPALARADDELFRGDASLRRAAPMWQQRTARTLEFTRLGDLLQRMWPWSGVVVFNYHRIGNATGSPFDHGLWSAGAAAFGEHIRSCKAHADVIGADDLPEITRRRRGRYVLITFDDGYRDNYDVAFPILKAEHVSALFFVTTGFIDSGRLSWWDEIAWMVRSSGRDRLVLPDWLAAPVVFDEPDRERAASCCADIKK
jgi:polysaccharide deacetylase